MQSEPLEQPAEQDGVGRWAVSLLGTVAVLAWALLTPEQVPPRPPPGEQMDQLATAYVAQTALWTLALWMILRLVGLLLAHPLVKALRPSAEVRAAPLPDPFPWRGVSLPQEMRIALGVLIATAGLRWVGAHFINPDGLPYGSDWHTYIQNARAVATGDWASYNTDKLLGFPWLAAKVAALVEWDFARACQWVNLGAMTLSSPFLYLCLRHLLGRTSALGGCLLFASGGIFQYFANSTTSYGLFAGMMITLAGLATLAVSQRQLRWFCLLGGVVGLSLVTEVKTVTVATPILGCVGLALLAPGTPWRLRLGGPLLVGVLASGIVQVAPRPVQFTPLELKLERQRVEIVRFMVTGPNRPLTPAEADSLMPDLATRVRYNLARTQAMAIELWPGLILLVGLGLAAPLLARGPLPFRQRIAALGPSVFLMGILGSTAGAYTLLFLPHYILHALPFLVALMVHGGWVVAAWLTPRGAPAVVYPLLGWGTVAQLVMVGASLHGMHNLTEPGPAGAWGLFQKSLPAPQLQTARAAREVARWIDAHVEARGSLLICDDSSTETFLLKVKPYREGGVHPMEICERSLAGAPVPGRLWVVDERNPAQFPRRMSAAGGRFSQELKLPLEAPPGPSIYVYRESGQAP